jgi:transcriptional regulator with XRE-family HTH domain
MPARSARSARATSPSSAVEALDVVVVAPLKAARAPRADGNDDLDHIVSSIGPKLRELRLQQRLSMQQLAERADVSAAAIHKIERSGMVPTITTLLKLAGALDRPVSYFVEEDAEESGPVVFTPAGARNSVYTSHRGIDLSGISGPYGRFFVAGAIATVEAGADSGPNPMEHPGEELVFVLDGTLEFTVEEQPFRLAKGDAIHFRTDRRHQWRNPGAKDAKAVWMALRPG